MASPDLGPALSALRRAAALGRTAVAAALGVARQTVYDWEEGERSPSPENLAALIRLYGCDEATELSLWRLRGGAAEGAAEVAA